MARKSVSRREFLQGAGALLATAAVSSSGLLEGCFSSKPETSSTTAPSTITQLPGIIYSPDTLRTNRIPLGQTETSTWPQVQSGGTPGIVTDDWSFTISGEVGNEIVLSYD